MLVHMDEDMLEPSKQYEETVGWILGQNKENIKDTVLQTLNRTHYREDSYDDLTAPTALESDGEEPDPWNEAIPTEDDPPSTLDEKHIQGYFKEIRKLCFGRTLPFLRFSVKLQRAGYGNVPLNGCWAGDLRDPILPVLRQENWIREPSWDTNNLLWKRLQPALRLATRLITNEHLQDWWVRALIGHQITDKATGRKYLSEPRITGTPAHEKVARKFKHLVDHVRLSFAKIRAENGQTQGLTVRTIRTLNNFSIEPEEGFTPYKDDVDTIHIGLHVNFRKYLLQDRYEDDEWNHECQRVRTNWILATTLVHEMAHAFYLSKAANRPNFNFKEPYFNVYDPMNEIGWSWERFMWGDGQFHLTVDSGMGAIALQWNPVLVHPRDPWIQEASLISYAVDPHWLHSFFLESNWDRFAKVPIADKPAFWKPPRANVATTIAPELRNSSPFIRVWVSDDFPSTDRRSIQYWMLKPQEHLKRRFLQKQIRAAQTKAEKADKPYRGHIAKDAACREEYQLRPRPKEPFPKLC